MAESYKGIFDARGHLYNEAGRICPEARERERELLISRLDVKNGDVIVDVPAGGGYVPEGIFRLPDTERVRILCVEPSAKFAEAITPTERLSLTIAPLEALGLPSECADKLASLAGLHHCEDKPRFFAEAFRVLRPGGRVVVGDVMIGTQPALYLNDSVDRLTFTGHNGMFFEQGDFERLLRDAGFTDIEEKYEVYTWDFPDWDTMLRYSKALFGLEKAESLEVVEQELTKHLTIRREEGGKVYIEWSLLYAAANKPAAVPQRAP